MSDCSGPEDAKVVIIGSGFAGLAAAATLVKAGFKNVLVLEAKERIGGRVNTTKPFTENIIEVGANWIHGQKGNPLYKIAKEQNLLSEGACASRNMCLPRSVSSRDYFFKEDGKPVPKKIVDQVSSLFSKLTDKAFDDELAPKHRDLTLGAYLDDAFGESPLAATEDGQQVFEWCKRTECTDEACSSLYEVSASQISNYTALEGGFFNTLGPGGYRAILDVLLKDVPSETIKCNAPVKSIRWDLVKEGNCEDERCPVQIVCENGQSFEADHVIVTVSLGVLKEKGATMFEPALPANKLSAIKNLGFGIVDKIFLFFEKRFWPEDCEGIQMVWKEGPEDKDVYDSLSEGDAWKTTWFKKITGFDTVARHPTALCGWITVWLFVTISSDEDYYKLLGISKEASTREIRQAFKKLALTMHPDKNPNDATAHEKFLKINRAYEVLKDEDLRKKYDKYGEKGLQDEQQGGRYESWNYYRYDFGIYDDDPEITTLDRGDFDAAVNSGEVWFVNFYFPRCSHCHDLAPTWREFAKEMDGVIRIGAVNCGDNGMLCRSKGINSYPSLYVFRAGMKPEKYYGDRTKSGLTTFAMQFVESKVTELWQGNIFSEIDRAFAERIGWLITFCADTGDCLEPQTRRKLAGMLDGLVNVGWMDCSKQADLCDSFEITTSTTALFPPGSSLAQKGSVLFILSLDTKEIYAQVLQHLPDLEILTKSSFEVGKVDCVADSELCASLYIQKPCVAVFKGVGIHDFEIHHGKDALYNVVAFAKESVNAHVTTLRPENFPSHEKEPWLVDFFAPWCPPCRALLPELRKASIQLFGQLKFGTLDCTVHERLCNMYNIHAYPTTVIFNKSSIHEYEGHHSADGILEFIEDLVNPVVVTLTPESFQELVKRRKSSETWMVDFYAPWCGPCQALLPEWRRMARMLSGIVNVGTVDCQKHHSFCQGENVRAYPEIRLFPQNNNRRDQYQSYNGWHRDAFSLKTWALSSLPRASVDLSPEDFKRKVLGGKDHWVLDFYAPWCGPCQQFAPEFEVLARMMKGTVRAGKVDCQAHFQTCQNAGITAYPSVRFYPHIGSTRRDQGGEHINSRDATVIADILRQRLQQLALQGKSSKLKDEL
ncbi:dnaJ -like protein [Labeo rohita]|uniref:DnaJ homolog subfamily C member 10 n=1 Tax=Labeo rohita TaxID=84645 RepID=A0A498LTP0_LABRO|nr:dnaJ -like protein [Labeo rohita]